MVAYYSQLPPLCPIQNDLPIYLNDVFNKLNKQDQQYILHYQQYLLRWSLPRQPSSVFILNYYFQARSSNTIVIAW